MSSTFTWCESNGGTTWESSQKTEGRAECNWKNVDDSTTSFEAAPVIAGNRSFEKFQYGKLGGSWNKISNVKFELSSNIDSSIELFTSNNFTRVLYRTPSKATPPNTSSKMLDGQRGMLLSKTAPDANDLATELVGGGLTYTSFLYSTLLVNPNATPGNSGPISFILSYDEC